MTRFELDAGFAQRYPVRHVGGQMCRELWVPADELDEFNQHIRGEIEVVASFGEASLADAPASKG